MSAAQQPDESAAEAADTVSGRTPDADGMPVDETGRSVSDSGTWLRRIQPGHECLVPIHARVGDIWRCDICGRRWTYRLGDHGGNWYRRWWPWPRMR